MQISVPNLPLCPLLLQYIINHKMWKIHQKRKSPRGRSPSGRIKRMPCKDHLKGTCANPSCEKWHSPEWSFHKSAEGCTWDHQEILRRPGVIDRSFNVSDPLANSRIQFRGVHLLKRMTRIWEVRYVQVFRNSNPPPFWLCEWPPSS